MTCKSLYGIGRRRDELVKLYKLGTPAQEKSAFPSGSAEVRRRTLVRRAVHVLERV